MVHSTTKYLAAPYEIPEVAFSMTATTPRSGEIHEVEDRAVLGLDEIRLVRSKHDGDMVEATRCYGFHTIASPILKRLRAGTISDDELERVKAVVHQVDDAAHNTGGSEQVYVSFSLTNSGYGLHHLTVDTEPIISGQYVSKLEVADISSVNDVGERYAVILEYPIGTIEDVIEDIDMERTPILVEEWANNLDTYGMTTIDRTVTAEDAESEKQEASI